MNECAAPWQTQILSQSPLVNLAFGFVLAYLVASKLAEWNVLYWLKLSFEFFFCPVPLVDVQMTAAERRDDGVDVEPSAKIDLRDPSRPTMIQCYDPSTLQRLGEVPAMTPDNVHDLLVKASIAQKEWARTSFAQRRRVLRTIQKYIVHHVEDICRVASRDSGKPKVDALLGEVLTTCEKIRAVNAYGELWLRPSYRPTGPLMLHKTAFVEYVPLGIVAPIAPWNYPFHNLLNHIISGIFAGNAVVGKVSEHTSWSASYFGRIVARALVEHGHNPNLCAIVTGYGDAGAALVSHPLVDKVVFTGSPGIGKKVMETASHVLKPVILELGGKDAMVVMEDCQLKDVVPWVMRGCFQNCGQNCVGIERVLVYESLHDAFVEEVTAQVKALRQGIPLETCGSSADVDCGSMVMDGQLDLIQALVDDAVKQGATVVTGGKRAVNGNGQFYEPTILTGVTAEMRVFQEEVFGPVMTIVRVPKDDDEACLRLVNNSAFGLGSSVYCGNQRRGLALGRQIRSGMLCINDFGSNYLVQSLPFGGVKESGFGRFAGIEGLQAMCLERSILVDRIPGIKTTIPPPINYPIDKQKGLPFAASLIQLFYNESIIGKIKGIFGLIKFG
jgi:acyl-CoA reductase-like NAD-dependent aldehyde dehydrogenase